MVIEKIFRAEKRKDKETSYSGGAAENLKGYFLASQRVKIQLWRKLISQCALWVWTLRDYILKRGEIKIIHSPEALIC